MEITRKLDRLDRLDKYPHSDHYRELSGTTCLGRLPCLVPHFHAIRAGGLVA